MKLSEKCVHKPSHNDLPLYFNIISIISILKIVMPYSLPLPVIAHTFAKSSLIFQLVNMKNNKSVNDSLILKRIKERSHAHSALSTLSKIPYYQDISMNALYTHVAHANRWNNQIILFLY